MSEEQQPVTVTLESREGWPSFPKSSLTLEDAVIFEHYIRFVTFDSPYIEWIESTYDDPYQRMVVHAFWAVLLLDPTTLHPEELLWIRDGGPIHSNDYGFDGVDVGEVLEMIESVMGWTIDEATREEVDMTIHNMAVLYEDQDKA